MSEVASEHAELVRAVVERWRDRLVNLSGTNRLLNFKVTKSSTVPVAAPDLPQVLERVANPARLGFLPMRPATAAATPEEALFDETIQIPESLEVNGQSVEDDVTTLGADLEPSVLSTALRTLMARSLTTFLDTGLRTLYLAAGTLTWTDPEGPGSSYRSPLVLWPVALQRPGRRRPPVLMSTDEEPVANPALQLKLASLGITLPDLDSGTPGGIMSWLESVGEMLASHDGWHVGQEAFLSYFTFHKEAMYRDLKDHFSMVTSSEFIQALASSGVDSPSDSFTFEPAPQRLIDKLQVPESAHQVLDSDASQRAAILAATEGKSFILDGPPGTGKSQTIANIIASLIALDRTVLFVSEKAAALEVVRNRLENVGLSSFLLELHSHKATRKEVALELGRSLETRPTPSQFLRPSDRALLQSHRASLTEYAAAMNLRREPLGMSLHRGLGMVARYEDWPSTNPVQVSMTSMTPEVLALVESAGAQLARSWRPVLQGSSYLWRDVKRREPLTFDLRSLQSQQELLEALSRQYQGLCAVLGWQRPSDLEGLADLLDVWAEPHPKVPQAWLTSESFEEVTDASSRAAELVDRLRRDQAGAFDKGGPDWAQIHQGSAGSPFEQVDSALAHLSPGWPIPRDMRLDEVRALRETLQRLSAYLSGVETAAAQLAVELGLLQPRTLSQVNDVLRVHELCKGGNRPEAAWLRPGIAEEAAQALTELKAVNDACQAARTQAMEHFLPSIVELDPRALWSRFQNIHTGLRRMAGGYRTDLRALGGATTPGIKPKASIQHLPLAVAWQEALERRSDSEARFALTLGPRYQQEATNWTLLEDALQTARAISETARLQDLDRLMQAARPDAAPNGLRDQHAEDCGRQLSSARESLASLGRGIPGEILHGLHLDALQGWLSEASRALEMLSVAMSDCARIMGGDQPFHACRAAWDATAAALESRQALTKEESHLKAVLEDAFQGELTDLGSLQQAVAWTLRLRQCLSQSSSAITQHASALPSDAFAHLEQASPSPGLRAGIATWWKAVHKVARAFDSPRELELIAEFNSWEFGPLLTQSLLEDDGGQDEWFSHLDALQELDSVGAGDVVRSAGEQRLEAAYVVGVLVREVMRAWCNGVIASDSRLQPTRSSDRDALAAEFRSLDRRLVELTAADIIDMATERRPTTRTGQARIILAEAQKKTRHMPIRKLLGDTAEVTTAIKPVFLMSPLSVSQFLDPRIKFDAVIFDEASQVMPEDAINCIYRGRQLIIAGDERQLPPTNFFSLIDDGDDAEWETDQSTAKDFESVLGIAKGSGAFTALTLRWHYRSRHEDLIAFSNSRFYGSQLITFPGVLEKGPDVGVEFFHVADGIYERGGARRNLPEARFIARRIAHHYDTRPGFSLGVVALSQQQADAIDLALAELVNTRPDLEDRFQTSRLDGFFVKSLESVQGDERDVMIFSIGYGPDEAGKFTMNFGPMNRDGGWRRLNVAVTRARYRVEVIASFLPDQMSSSGSRSIEELRRYLQYSVKGTAALLVDSPESMGDAESPFEESVCDWLRSQGLDVVTQVGCSQYRIDMAVRDPRHKSRFIIGIECDGAAYHSSAAARDRDRLREQVLTGLGWKLHRIWGTAWYRHRAEEQHRLLNAIGEAMAAPLAGSTSSSKSAIADAYGLVNMEAYALVETPDWVRPYEVCKPPPPPARINATQPEAVPYLVETISAVIQVEGPVHMDLLDQRIRDAWSVGRIGPNIRGHIEAAIRRGGYVRDGDFLASSSLEEPQRTRTHEGITRRDIKHVHGREIEDTAFRIVSDARAIPADELVVLTARYLGFLRVGSDVRAAIEGAISRLELGKRLITEHGQYRVFGSDALHAGEENC